MPRVTQQQFIDAHPLELGSMWLHFGVNEPQQVFNVSDRVQLVGYRVVPVGNASGEILKPGGGRGTLDLPMALTGAEAGSLHDALPLRRPLWLQRVAAGPVRSDGTQDLNLYVDLGDSPEVASKQVRAAAPALKAVDRIQYEPSMERLTDLVAMDLTAPSGQSPEFWVLKHYRGHPLPMLHVLQGSEHRAVEWAQLYARLVLGEDVER